MKKPRQELTKAPTSYMHLRTKAKLDMNRVNYPYDMECYLLNYSMGKSEFYMSYVDIHSCCIRKCLRYAQIHLQYGQLYMSYTYMCKFMCDIDMDHIHVSVINVSYCMDVLWLLK